jgi:hypothetical protein
MDETRADHYEYVAVYVDDLLIAESSSAAFGDYTSSS